MDHLVARWRAAEREFYERLLYSRETYEGHLTAVRKLADSLSSCVTARDLAKAWENVAAAARDWLNNNGIGAGIESVDLLSAAAFALRYREVISELEREEVAARIRKARAEGKKWVTIREVDSPTSPTSIRFYDRVDMQLSNGAGLHVFVETDLDRDGRLYGVEVVYLDANTGDLLGVDPRKPRRFSDVQKWKLCQEQVRERLSVGSRPKVCRESQLRASNGPEVV
jgi:hypothetical protein